MNRNQKISFIRSKLLYLCGTGIIIIGICISIMPVGFQRDIFGLIPPCTFHAVTGYYCFGCGGTRAVKALMHGRLLKSAYYNIDILYFAVLFVWYMASNSLNIITRGRIQAMKIKPAYGYAVIFITVFQCVVKNLILFISGVRLM